MSKTKTKAKGDSARRLPPVLHALRQRRLAEFEAEHGRPAVEGEAIYRDEDRPVVREERAKMLGYEGYDDYLEQREAEAKEAGYADYKTMRAVRDAVRDAARVPRRVGTRVGRNAPCPCGSGLKSKRCCG